jgi:hypothetical protein
LRKNLGIFVSELWTTKKYIRLFVLLLVATSARAQTTQVTAKFSYDDGTAVAGSVSLFRVGPPDVLMGNYPFDAQGRFSSAITLDPAAQYRGRLLGADGTSVILESVSIPLPSAVNADVIAVLPTGEIDVIISKSNPSVASAQVKLVPFAAPVVVQRAPVCTSNNPAPVATLNGVGAHHWLGVAISVQSYEAINSVSDGANVYLQDPKSPSVNLGQGRVAFYYAENVAGGNTSVKVTFAGTPDSSCVEFFEVSGLAASSSRDVSAAASFTNAATPSAGAVTTSLANDLLIGVLAEHPSMTIFTPAGGYAALFSDTTNWRGAAEFRIAGPAGSYPDGWKLSPANSGAALLVAFKAATAN